jgi:hypothetical protein
MMEQKQWITCCVDSYISAIQSNYFFVVTIVYQFCQLIYHITVTYTSDPSHECTHTHTRARARARARVRT